MLVKEATDLSSLVNLNAAYSMACCKCPFMAWCQHKSLPDFYLCSRLMKLPCITISLHSPDEEHIEKASLALHYNSTTWCSTSLNGIWASSQYKTIFPRYGDPMIKIRRSQDRLIFNMGFPILARWHLYIEIPSPQFSEQFSIYILLL